MNHPAIRVENLGKLYRIGSARERNKTFREAMTNTFAAPWRYMKNTLHKQPVTEGEKSDYIWALKEVSFEVKRGEVVGIIGRNGAGKSTLLKILSRITEPTEGRIVMRGRIGSLLEVGTGFHSELTGEENIYLSGTILGMSSDEISRKFDEIVAFAEMGKFIHTPVKHYSSGMYMRLAFAVAAHLEPEILMIDEVLAVGDSKFQKKCLGKMGDVANEGRTVLFVSHNMAAVQSLCKTVIELESGHIVQSGDSRSVVSRYLANSGTITSEMIWNEQSTPGNDAIRLNTVRAYAEAENDGGVYQSGQDIYIEMRFSANKNPSDLCVGFDLLTPQGETVLRSYQTDLPAQQWLSLKQGQNVWRCRIPGGLLNGGIYHVCPRIGVHNLYWIVYLDSVVQFEVVLGHGISPLWNSLDRRSRPGTIAPILQWQAMQMNQN
jgi:lipopolysaccharide transport system ATP-binding protein